MSFFIIAKVAFLRLNVASLNAVKNAISFAHLATRVHQSVSLHFHFHRRDHPRAPQTVVNSVWSLGSLVCAVSLLFRTGIISQHCKFPIDFCCHRAQSSSAQLLRRLSRHGSSPTRLQTKALLK